MTSKTPKVSFEFFPPKTPEGEQALWRTVEALAVCKPALVTMTMTGNDGPERSTDLAIELGKRNEFPAAAHLTFIRTTKNTMRSIAQSLWDNNVRHIVALRGDGPPPADKDNHFTYTSDFVEGLKSWHPFDISVGAYPEKHPDAADLSADIEALRKKCEAGANRAITQFFFDNNVFYEFREAVAKAGIDTPVVPGILPITDYHGMLRFAERCKATVPRWLRDKFDQVEGDEAGAAQLAEEILTEQVTGLAANGVHHLHFYTLNKSALSLKAWSALNA